MSDYTISLDLNGRIGKIIIPADATKSELGLIQNTLNRVIEARIEHARLIEVAKNPLNADINDLGVSVRLTNVLKRAGLNTVADVLSCSKSEIARFRNMGKNTYEECIKVFGQFGEFKFEDIKGSDADA